jgi:ADP-ribose pyrophosphatase
MQAWKRIDDRSNKTKAGFRTIIHKRFAMNNGQIIDADIIGDEASSAAGVIALTKDNKVIIAKQFRCGPEKIMYEMPGGAVDDGETPEIAARRELREEVGYDAENLQYLGAAYVNAWDNMIHHYFLARDVYSVGASNPEEFEEIEIEEISISEFIDNALNARMTDAQGVLLAYDTLRELEKKHD